MMGVADLPLNGSYHMIPLYLVLHLYLMKYFISGYLKSKVYANKPDTIKILNENIRKDMQSFSTAMHDKPHH